jgi:hypothetical protein
VVVEQLARPTPPLFDPGRVGSEHDPCVRLGLQHSDHHGGLEGRPSAELAGEPLRAAREATVDAAPGRDQGDRA